MESVADTKNRSDKFVEDPLTAALPPNTDYITYLTILEYQLTPKNLPTLNQLLQDDDGTLASEIGWDLLKLVLPILRVEPDKARECLDIIARRGNPREVVVRVAEELETLGHDDSETEADTEAVDDGLPTFAGEAPRVHLGHMKLDGKSQPERPSKEEPEREDDDANSAIEELKLQALLSMLGLLHPRIKTQHPSRFLATSLPAALSAYRRLSMKSDSTLAFISALSKLSGKKRPALPPRMSTADILASMKSSSTDTTDVMSAPLPDPESKTDKTTASQSMADNEAAINQRLIQAVLLEVVDEFTSASSEAQPPLTARLRAQFEPHSITSVRRAQLETLTSHPDLERADKLRNKFVLSAQDMRLDVATEVSKLYQGPQQDPEDDPESEYPTSPSQIPFSSTGLLLLYSAQLYQKAISTQTPPELPSNLTVLLEAVDTQYETDARLRYSTPAIDSLLSLLYVIFCMPSEAPTPPPTIEAETLSLAIYNILQDIFTSCPDGDLRDNAYHIASHLVHGHTQRATRLKIIQGLLRTDAAAVKETASPVQEAQMGNLRSIAVDWLKDEIWPTQAATHMMNRLVGDSEKERGLPVDILREIGDVVFQASGMSDVPSTAATADNAHADTLELFAAELPFYISALNLFCVLVNHHNEHGREIARSEAELDAGAGGDVDLAVVIAKGDAMLARLEAWRAYLGQRVAGNGGNSGLEEEGVSLADVFAFEDAVGRAREVLPVREEEES